MRAHGRRRGPGRSARSASAASMAAPASRSTRTMQPLHPCLIWMDRRAEAQVEWVRAHVDLERLVRRHRQRRRQLLRLHQDAVAARRAAGGLGAHGASSCRRTPTSSSALTGELAVDHSLGRQYRRRLRHRARAPGRTRCWTRSASRARMMPERLVASTRRRRRRSPPERAARLGLRGGNAGRRRRRGCRGRDLRGRRRRARPARRHDRHQHVLGHIAPGSRRARTA